MRATFFGTLAGGLVGLVLGWLIDRFGDSSATGPGSFTSPDWVQGGVYTVHTPDLSPYIMCPFLGLVFGFLFVLVRRNWQT